MIARLLIVLACLPLMGGIVIRGTGGTGGGAASVSDDFEGCAGAGGDTTDWLIYNPEPTDCVIVERDPGPPDSCVIEVQNDTGSCDAYFKTTKHVWKEALDSIDHCVSATMEYKSAGVDNNDGMPELLLRVASAATSPGVHYVVRREDASDWTGSDLSIIKVTDVTEDGFLCEDLTCAPWDLTDGLGACVSGTGSSTVVTVYQADDSDLAADSSSWGTAVCTCSSALPAACTGAGTPHTCCTGSGTGPTCWNASNAVDTGSYIGLGIRPIGQSPDDIGLDTFYGDTP